MSAHLLMTILQTSSWCAGSVRPDSEGQAARFKSGLPVMPHRDMSASEASAVSPAHSSDMTHEDASSKVLTYVYTHTHTHTHIHTHTLSLSLAGRAVTEVSHHVPECAKPAAASSSQAGISWLCITGTFPPCPSSAPGLPADGTCVCCIRVAYAADASMIPKIVPGLGIH
jgi:hypothetical protein